MLRITALRLYPVKSLSGIDVVQWPIGSKGLRYDRNWMIVDEEGQFVTQRKLARMALIHTEIRDQRVHLSFDGEGSVSFPLACEPTCEPSFKVHVWDDECQAQHVSSQVDEWLNRILKHSSTLRLVSMAKNFERQQSQSDRFGEDAAIFADAAPLLLTNQSSLQALNEVLEKTQQASVDMRRFRPNIVIEGLSAFAEQEPQDLVHSEGNYALRLADACERCVMIQLDPDSAERNANAEPYRSLAKSNPQPGKPKLAFFGMNCLFVGLEGTMIAVGDPLKRSSK
jgi:uncharacterized protein YcbX